MHNKLLSYLQPKPIGLRIIKTCIAVTLCLLFYMLRGYRGAEIPAEAAITAIICMDTNMRGTRENAFSRIAGTLIGAFWGFVFLLIVPLFPVLNEKTWWLFLLMGIGTLLSLYSSVLVKKPDVAGLAGIVFICVVVSYPDVEGPMEQAFHRILDVLVGTTIALMVNAFRLPRKKMRDKIFFVRLKDLKPDQFADVPSTILYRLRFLLQDGARICLMSAHAPSFWDTQLGSLKFAVPMIVMDGAAVYDPNENSYLMLNTMDSNASRWLMKRLESLDRSYFTYTVHRDRNCIFHHGEMTEMESIVYRHLKRSPYRYYLEDDHFPKTDIVYLKIVGSLHEVEQIQKTMEPAFDKMKIRAVIRKQAGVEDGYGLYFFSMHATMENAEKQLMHLLKTKEADLEMQEVFSPQPYRTERDGIRLIRRLTHAYEPLYLSWWLRKLFDRKQQHTNAA